MTTPNYASWSAQQLKAAGSEVEAAPLNALSDLLVYGQAQAALIDTGLQDALSFLMGGWTGQAAANAHQQTTMTAQHSDLSSRDAGTANTRTTEFATNLVASRAEVSGMPNGTPPQVSDYLPWALLSPAGATAAYLYAANQAENQRQALVAKITAMDAEGQNAGAAVSGVFGTPDIRNEPPPVELDEGPGGPAGGGSTATRSTPAAQGASGSTPGTATAPPTATGATPVAPAGAVPSASGQTVPGAAGAPGGLGSATVPGDGAAGIPAAAGAGTLPQSFTVPTAAGAVGSPTAGMLPGGASVPSGAGLVGGAGGVGGALLGGALATGGASAALGSSSVGLPGTVAGGWRPGAAGGLAGEPATGPGMSGQPGAMRPGSGTTGQSPRRTVGRTVGRAGGPTLGRSGVTPTGAAEPGGTRPGVLSPGQGAGAGGRGGRNALSRNVGANPAGTGRGVAGGRRRRRDEDDELNGRPDYLVESDDVWGDGRTVVRGVLGQRPDNGEGKDL